MKDARARARAAAAKKAALDLAISVKSFGAKGDGSTDDTNAINLAIAAVAANGGGILYFPAGDYLTTGGHVLTVPCVVRGQGFGTIGAGNGTSTLHLKTAANTDMLTLAAKNITVEDLGLYGNKGNQTTTSRGLVMSSTVNANYFRINRVWVGAFRDDGIVLQGPGTSLEGIASQLRVDSCGGYGLSQAGSAGADCQFTDCILTGNASGGANVNAGSVFTACHIWGNTGPGVFMPSGSAGTLRMVNCYLDSNGGAGLQLRGRGNQIVGCYIWKSGGRGIYAFSNTGLVVQGCVITDNNTINATGATGAGVNLDTCTACAVTGNFMAETGNGHQKYGYAESGNTCNACVFSGNVSRAIDHGTGNWLIGTGNPTATIPATPASYNVG